MFRENTRSKSTKSFYSNGMDLAHGKKESQNKTISGKPLFFETPSMNAG